VSREIPIVEGLQLAAADEPALAGVLTEYLFEIVGVLRDRLLGDPIPKRRKRECGRRVGVELSVLIVADAAKRAAVRTGDTPRLVVRPLGRTGLTDALARESSYRALSTQSKRGWEPEWCVC